MKITEAINSIKARMFPLDYEKYPGRLDEQAQTDLEALKCMEAQIRLQNLLSDIKADMQNEIHENDTYSLRLVYDMLSSIRHDAKFDEDGIFIPFEEV